MFRVEETIRRRKSIRSYENRPLSPADREAVRACCFPKDFSPAVGSFSSVLID